MVTPYETKDNDNSKNNKSEKKKGAEKKAETYINKFRDESNGKKNGINTYAQMDQLLKSKTHSLL